MPVMWRSLPPLLQPAGASDAKPRRPAARSVRLADRLRQISSIIRAVVAAVAAASLVARGLLAPEGPERVAAVAAVVVQSAS